MSIFFYLIVSLTATVSIDAFNRVRYPTDSWRKCSFGELKKLNKNKLDDLFNYAFDENAEYEMENQLFQIMAEGPPPIMVGPDQWLNNGYKTKELANGFYSSSSTHWNRFSIEQQGDDVVLIYTHPKQGVKKLWQGSADSVTHFEFYGGVTLAVSDFVDIPAPTVSAAEAMAMVVPWAINEGYMNEYYLSTNGIAIGSEDDHLLIGDWANIGLAGDQIPDLGPIDPSSVLTLAGGYGDDKLVAATGTNGAQLLVGREGNDTFVLKGEAGAIFAVGGEGVDQFFVEQGSALGQTIIYADQGPIDGQTENTDFGDAVYFDWAFSQDDITRLDDGSIQVSDGSDSVTIYDAEFLYFRDEFGEYQRIPTTFGEIITAAAWSDSDLAANFDNLDPSLFTFSVEFDTDVNGMQTDKLTMSYDGQAVWSGDRWQVDKFELPQDASVNVVNVQETDALTGETFDPNAFTTEGTDLIFGDDNVNIIDAKGGNDIIFAGGGDDVIIGGDGDDLIFGQEGDDILRGDEADDIAAAYFDDDYFIDPSVDPGDVIDPDGGGGPGDELDPSLIGDDNVDPSDIIPASADGDDDLSFAGSDLIEGGDGIDDIAGGEGSDALAADEFNNFDLDGDGLTSDTLSDLIGFEVFDDEPEDLV